MSKNNEKLCVGIDLGTTFSLVSVLQNGRPVVLPNAMGEVLTPSVVSLGDDGHYLVGSAAKARLTTHPERTAALFKRAMGTDEMFLLGDKRLRPEELSAMVLKTLREDAEAALGRKVDEAVVTVPAYFGELQRRATRDACEIAGLYVERIINEPTAAALAFGLHALDRELRAVVLDLGGGTFDVTALEIIEGVVEIQSSAGDSRLGGEDFSEALSDWAVSQLEGSEGAVPHGLISRRRLLAACDQAKRRLSEAPLAQIVVSQLELTNGKLIDFAIELSRQKAEEIWGTVLGRLSAPIRRALSDAKWAADVDEVILVGGATRMPCFINLATQIFGKLPKHDLPPDEAVALGAAIQAALKAGDEAVDDLVVTDVAPFTLGTEVVEQVGSRTVDGIFLPILDRGTVLPASRTREISPATDGQTSLTIHVYQGEHSLCSKNQKLGEYAVKGIPRGPAGKEVVELRYSYDLNGILEVESTVVSTGKKSVLVIERSPGRLSAADVKKARKAMEAFKFHPRDALPNVTALSRADALHAELRGSERDQLAHVITGFRGALEGQEPSEITAARERLIHMVESLRYVR